MNSIVINPKDEKELKFVSQLLRKMGVDSEIISDEQKEDMGLEFLMRDANRSEVVDSDEIYKKLQV